MKTRLNGSAPEEAKGTMNKNKKKKLMREVSNSFVIDLLYAVSKQFSISITDVILVFDEMDYWKILNDDEVCCLLAHDGVKDTVDDLEDKIKVIISRNR